MPTDKPASRFIVIRINLGEVTDHTASKKRDQLVELAGAVGEHVEIIQDVTMSSRSRKLSLVDEPFAAAMRELPPMASEIRERVGERLLKLAGARRQECVDFEAGETEIHWHTRGSNSSCTLARGNRGRGRVSVILFDARGEQLVEWEGDVACKLTSVGCLAGRSRKDARVPLTMHDELYLAEREV